jgi:hypothetical protein
VAEPLTSHPDQVRQLFDAKAPTWSASARVRAAGGLSGLSAGLPAAACCQVVE